VSPLVGKVTEVRLVQPENALLPILVFPLVGKVTEVRLVQPWNAFAPIFVTPDGIFMEVRLVQL